MTALDNPNSVQQMKQWLSDNGLETDSLGKKEVAELLKTAPPELPEGSHFSGSSWPNRPSRSIRRWKRQSAPMVVLVECFMFYGANRTGRLGRHALSRLQNLPQNHLPDSGRGPCSCPLRRLRWLWSCLYEDVPDTLSQLIRTAFIPRDGDTSSSSPTSAAIEARVHRVVCR